MIALKSPLSIQPSKLENSIGHCQNLIIPISSGSVEPSVMHADEDKSDSMDAPTPMLAENEGMSPPTGNTEPTSAPSNEVTRDNSAIPEILTITNSRRRGAGKGGANPVQPELAIRTSDTYSFAGFKPRSDDDDPPQSVIHAPPGFGDFKTNNSQIDPSSNQTSESNVIDLNSKTDESQATEGQSVEKRSVNSPLSPPPLTTAIPPEQDWSERATPRAQTRQEIEDLDPERRPHSSNLEDIPESADIETAIDEIGEAPDKGKPTPKIGQIHRDEISALRRALTECWTLCNTLANLSHIHRERLFNFASKGDVQEAAWKSCWRLCQKLYDSRDDDYASHITPTLELCRDFCQALFEVRVRDNEIADSVLRVSFELNNHLYNTQDRNLPEVFRERTLDFYITLCHRLMKQRMDLAEEADSLLHACWSLAEMLFSIRQNKREGKEADEELLGSAIQACWELSDLFREGWTQIRPDRGTPRPSQTAFIQAFHQAKQSEAVPAEEALGQLVNPETPTTIFEDTATVSPEEAPIPNILVLGHAQGPANHPKWSSNSSTLSSRSRSSEQSSSTNTVTSPSEDPNLVRLKLLITKAALNSGYQRGGLQNLSSFAKSLSSDSFGSLPWQVSLLEHYRKLVVFDPAFRVISPPGRAGAVDVARAVQSMIQSGQYGWLQDLYRLVFGFHPEEAVGRRNVTVQT